MNETVSYRAARVECADTTEKKSESTQFGNFGPFTQEKRLYFCIIFGNRVPFEPLDIRIQMRTPMHVMQPVF